jgi:hypothetical protein
MANVDDVIYVLGGINNDGILETMETYNVETNTWTKICTSIPRPTCYASIVGELSLSYNSSFMCVVLIHSPYQLGFSVRMRFSVFIFAVLCSFG